MRSTCPQQCSGRHQGAPAVSTLWVPRETVRVEVRRPSVVSVKQLPHKGSRSSYVAQVMRCCKDKSFCVCTLAMM